MKLGWSASHRAWTRAPGLRRLVAGVLVAGAVATAGCAPLQGEGVAPNGEGGGGEPADAVWFSRYTMQEGGLGYVGVAEDGQALVVADIGYPGEAVERADQIRTGTMPAPLRDRFFRIATDEAIYTTRVEGPGEVLFYEGVLLRIGSWLEGRLRAADYVPLAGLVQEAREVLEEVAAWAGTLTPDARVRLLVSAEAVEPDRAESIRTDPRGFYRFVAVGPADMVSAPALARATLYARLLVAVEDDGEASQIAEWLDLSNPGRVGSYFFLETPERTVFQVHLIPVGSE